MRRIACTLLLLLPACLDYEIAVTTVVQADGSIRRKLTIRARDQGKPADAWKRLKRPDGPYKAEGDDEKGFTATAEMKAGACPSGLRVLLGGLDIKDGEPPKDVPAAEGTVDVRATNLLIGTLYRYEERIALGTDPVKFRESLPRWLDMGLRVLIDALKLKFQDIDFAPVEARARAELLPAIERALVNLHHAITAMMLESGPLAPAAPPELLARSEFWPAIAREAAAFGIEMPKDEAAFEAMFEGEEAGNRMVNALRERLVDRLLAPLPEARRAEVREALLAEDALEEQLEEAGKKLYPGKDAEEKLQQEMLSSATSGLGAFVVYGIFDSFDLRFRVELPGKPLRTNGDLSRLPAVEWHLTKGDNLFLVPPVLYAYSFVPGKGVPGEGWDLGRLANIQDALAELTPEARAEVAVVLAGALAEGWKDEKDEGGLLGESHTDASHKALGLIREAIEAAKGDAPKEK
jgi:hypothetical protein